MTTFARACAVLAILSALAGAAACGRLEAPSSSREEDEGTGWTALRNALVEEYLKAHPAFAVVAGRHEYDGQLPDWSAAGIAADIRRLHGMKDRALAVPDSALDAASRLERDTFVARMDRDLFWLETAEAPFVNPAFYLDWMVDNLDPAPYLTRNYAPLGVRMRAYTNYARSVQQAAPQIRATLRTPLSRPLL